MPFVAHVVKHAKDGLGLQSSLALRQGSYPLSIEGLRDYLSFAFSGLDSTFRLSNLMDYLADVRNLPDFTWTRKALLFCPEPHIKLRKSTAIIPCFGRFR